MGCLNSTEKQFSHWFGNIHLSGPCNRACYFCIGQHMMTLDSYNSLDTWPLLGIEEFIETCIKRGVTEINVTGTNTDPLLFKHSRLLHEYLSSKIDKLVLGLRTNGVVALQKEDIFSCYHKGSVTVCSFDHNIYAKMMGKGSPPNLKAICDIAKKFNWTSLKVNIVLGPENVLTGDVFKTCDLAHSCGIKKINLREPYGQPHIGDPFAKAGFVPIKKVLGMPCYDWYGTQVTYWDVHYVEVESVNLYASGRVSETYPITKGHHVNGTVQDQSHFPGGRVQKQWIQLKKK